MESLQSNESPAQILIDLLKECDIPCTYSHIRGVLGWLSNKWQVSRTNKEKLWPLLKDQLVNYEVKEEERDLFYVLCQVANALNHQPLRKARERLNAQTNYAVGILALLPDTPEHITGSYALEHLLNAYSQDKAIDIQIALLLLYEQLGYFDLRHSLLQQIVSKLAQNLNLLLKLPQPLEIDNIDQKIIEEFDQGNLKSAEEKLEKKLNKANSRSQDIPKINFNLALFRSLQGDLHGALDYLEKVAPNSQTSSWEEQSYEFQSIHLAYYQLALYLYYQLGRFEEVHNMVAQCMKQNFHPWLKTWLAYVFFASGKRELSQELIQANGEPGSKKGNVLRQEEILLSWYLQETNPVSPQALNEEEVKRLRLLLFQPDSSDCLQPNLSLRLFPNTPIKEFDKIIEYALQYDVPEYPLQLYEQESSVQDFVRDRDHTQKLISLALLRANLNQAEAMVQDYWRKTPKNHLAAALVLSFYEDFLLEPPAYLNNFLNQDPSQELSDLKRNLAEKVKNLCSQPPEFLDKDEYPTSNRVSQLIDEWLKTTRDRELVANKLMKLLNQSLALRKLYWGRQDLRHQLWQVLQHCLDYGCVSCQDIIPYYSSLEPLSDTVFHLLYVGRHQAATELIQETRQQFKTNNSQEQYLNLLEDLSKKEPSSKLHHQLFYLKQLFPWPSSYMEIETPELGISALELLVHYPEPTYQTLAVLRLMSLSVGYPKQVSWSQKLPKQGESSQLLHSLAKLLPGNRVSREEPSLLTDSEQESENLLLILKNLEQVLKALQDKKKYETELIKSILQTLPQSSEGQVFALELYKYLVTRNPHKGKHPEDKHLLKPILEMFSAYQSQNPSMDRLAEEIEQTVAKIVDECKSRFDKLTRSQDYEIREEWEKFQENLTQPSSS
ncbi:MAG: hypothetical protein F6K41_17230 [Symploca sp. SIO3E6]|nr:hypothetical protein [Caldora sp. SIO3E6]